MADWDDVQTFKTELPPKIYPWGQPQCYRNTNMDGSNNPTANACFIKKNKTKMGIFQYGFYGKISSNDLHQSLQFFGRSR